MVMTARRSRKATRTMKRMEWRKRPFARVPFRVEGELDESGAADNSVWPSGAISLNHVSGRDQRNRDYKRTCLGGRVAGAEAPVSYLLVAARLKPRPFKALPFIPRVYGTPCWAVDDSCLADGLQSVFIEKRPGSTGRFSLSRCPTATMWTTAAAPTGWSGAVDQPAAVPNTAHSACG